MRCDDDARAERELRRIERGEIRHVVDVQLRAAGDGVVVDSFSSWYATLVVDRMSWKSFVAVARSCEFHDTLFADASVS